ARLLWFAAAREGERARQRGEAAPSSSPFPPRPATRQSWGAAEPRSTGAGAASLLARKAASSSSPAVLSLSMAGAAAFHLHAQRRRSPWSGQQRPPPSLQLARRPAAAGLLPWRRCSICPARLVLLRPCHVASHLQAVGDDGAMAVLLQRVLNYEY
ncbi:unnamed protein product, partial [Urochloa humidicola]